MITEQGGGADAAALFHVRTGQWLSGRSHGDVQTREGVRIEDLTAARRLAKEKFSDSDHRDQRNHREPRKTVAECRSAVSNA